MNRKATVQINLNCKNYTLAVADRLAQLVTAGATNKAKQTVANPDSGGHPYSKGPLRNSIHNVRKGFADYEVQAGGGTIEYAAAQEWGLGKYGKPGYTFKPYMRPAARWVQLPEQLTKYLKRAEEAAANIAKVSK